MTNEYGALVSWPEWVKELVAELEKRGAFERGITHVGSRRHGGFQAVNIDLYGCDESQGLAVIQVRESYKRKASHWMRIRKNYFLIGRNENGNAFAHSIPSPRHSTQDAVTFALRAIWHCTEKQLGGVVRNGDVAFIPTRRPTADLEPITFPVLLADSHLLTGKLLLGSNGELYADGQAELRHQPGQHPTVGITRGFYAVRVGYRAPVWDFAQSTQD